MRLGKRGWRYLILGVLAYGAFLVHQLPAKLVWHWSEPWRAAAGVALQAQGIAGTLWQGEIDRLEVGGHELRQVSWRLRPAELLLGRLAVDLYARLGGGYVQARVMRGLSTEVALRDLNARLPMDAFLALAQVAALQLDGELLLNLERLELERGLPVAAEGKIAWHGAASRFPQRVHLGNLQAQLATEGRDIIARLSDAGGPLQLEGSLKLTDGRYSLDIWLAARQRNSALARALRLLGRPDAKGRVRLTQSGALTDLGLGV